MPIKKTEIYGAKKLKLFWMCTCEVCEVYCKLGGYLCDHVHRKVAGENMSILHQQEDSVRHLLQLAVRQIWTVRVNILILFN